MANENRIRYAILPVATLTAEYSPLTDTVLTAGEFADYPEITSTAHLPLWVNRDREDFSAFAAEPYLLYGTAHTLGSTSITVTEAPENVIDRYYLPVGCKVHHGMTRRDIIKCDSAEHLDANIQLNAGTPTNWRDIPTITNTKDLALECYAGDRVAVSASLRCFTENVHALFDVHSNPDGTPYSWGSRGTVTHTHQGIAAWLSAPTDQHGLGGRISRIITSAEIVSGTLTLRMKVRLVSATNRLLLCATADGHRWEFCAENLGPDSEKPVLPTFS